MADTTRSRVRDWINASRALGVVRSLKPAASAEPTFEPVAPDPEVLAAVEAEADAVQRRLASERSILDDFINAHIRRDVDLGEVAAEVTGRRGDCAACVGGIDWEDVERLVLDELAVRSVGSSSWDAAWSVFGGGAAVVDAAGKAPRSAVERVAP